MGVAPHGGCRRGAFSGHVDPDDMSLQVMLMFRTVECVRGNAMPCWPAHYSWNIIPKNNVQYAKRCARLWDGCLVRWFIGWVRCVDRMGRGLQCLGGGGAGRLGAHLVRNSRRGQAAPDAKYVSYRSTMVVTWAWCSRLQRCSSLGRFPKHSDGFLLHGMWLQHSRFQGSGLEGSAGLCA